MLFGMPLLSLAIWMPIFFGVAVLVTGDRNAFAARWLALIGAALSFLVTIPLYTQFNLASAGMQLHKVEIVPEPLMLDGQLPFAQRNKKD